MIFKRQLGYDIKGVLTDWVLYLGLIMSILPAIGIIYSIKEWGGPFDMVQVTYFYTFFGSVLSVITAIRPFVKDLQNNTIVLFMNQTSNRFKYYASKTVSSAFVGFLFGIVGTGVIYFGASYADISMETELYYLIIIHYILFTLFYGSVFLAFSTFVKSPIGLIVTAILSILLLPTLLEVPLYIDNVPEFVITFITDYLPLNFAPEVIGSHDFSTGQYISIVVWIFLLIVLGMMKMKRTDY